MYKILHLPTATYVKWYKSQTNCKLEDITFYSFEDAEVHIRNLTVRKFSNNIDYIFLIQSVSSEGIRNLKASGLYVPKEHLSVVEVI